MGMLILSHRGLTAVDRPENTAAAVAAAFDTGAHGVEVDLRLTADGVLCLSHDPDLRRLTGLPLAVADSPWQALHDAALRRSVRLARAEEALALAAGRRVVVELKPPGPGWEARTAAAVSDLLQSLPGASADPAVTVSSFSPTLVGTVRASLPPGSAVRTAQLGRRTEPPGSVLRRAVDLGLDEVHLPVLPLLADPGVVDAAHARGLEVAAWTVNRSGLMRRLDMLGVDSLITDVPGLAIRALARAVR